MKIENEGMLAAYRVLDLTNEFGFLCGRLLADVGADVIKIEKPGGDPARNIAPYCHDIPHAERSLHWFFYNANKRSITLDIEKVDGKEIFKKLVQKADFVVESFQPGYMDRLGLGYKALSEINPRIIMASISPFGQTGPYSKYKSSDLVSMALSGWMSKCGDPDRAPVLMGGFNQTGQQVSAQAAAAMLMAHYYREKTGEGQYIDATAVPLLIRFVQPLRWYVTKHNEQRHGQLWEWSGRPPIRYVWDCKDGAVCFSITGGVRFGEGQRALIKWMDSEGIAPDSLKKIKWDDMDFSTVDQETRNSFEEPVAKFFKQKTKAELYQESSKRGIALFPASTAKEVFENKQLAAREYWTEVEHLEIGETITYPGAFIKSSEPCLRKMRRAPLIGEHNEEIFQGELGFTKGDINILKQGNII